MVAAVPERWGKPTRGPTPPTSTAPRNTSAPSGVTSAPIGEPPALFDATDDAFCLLDIDAADLDLSDLYTDLASGDADNALASLASSLLGAVTDKL